jgi:hypothetical protein
MEPKIWGRYMWTSIHTIALGYPDNPSEQDKTNYKEFYTNLWKVIPCQRCSDNYQKHLLELPIDEFLSTNDDLFKWTVDLHNIVNKYLNKPVISLQQAQDIFTQLARGDHTVLGGLDKRWEQLTLFATYGTIVLVLVVAIFWMLRRRL